MSVTKSVLSILVGIAIDKGLLRLDQRLPELIAEATERPIDPRAADITLRDLLTMSSGFDPHHEMVEGAGVRSSSVWMIMRTVRHTPGTHFYYDDEGTNLVAIILRRAVGGNIGEFAKIELFGPLQIDRYLWIVDGDGNLPGFSGLLLTGRDMAKIGLLYIQQGRWRERQVVSKAYVLNSTRAHIDGSMPGLEAGYGYLWWTRPTREGWRPILLPAYGADSVELSGPESRDGASICLHPSWRGHEVYQRGCVTRRSGAAGGDSVRRAVGSVTEVQPLKIVNSVGGMTAFGPKQTSARDPIHVCSRG